MEDVQWTLKFSDEKPVEAGMLVAEPVEAGMLVAEPVEAGMLVLAMWHW